MKTIPNQIRAKLAEQFNLPQMAVESDSLVTTYSVPVNGPLALIVKELEIKVTVREPEVTDEQWCVSVKTNYTHHAGGCNGIRRDFVPIIIESSWDKTNEVVSVVSDEDYRAIYRIAATAVRASIEAEKGEVK